MNTGIIKRLSIFLLLLILTLAVGACTRSASTQPPDASTLNSTSSGEMTGQQATMEAVRSALLTQTAQAEAPVEEPTETLEPTAIPATNTPEPSATQEADETGETADTETAEETVTTAASGGSTEYTVLQGEWVYSIASKLGVDPQAIIDLNNLEAPYSLTVGQVLLIPSDTATTAPTSASPTQAPTSSASGTEYTVLDGEWVYSIARKFGVDPQAIIDTNNLQAPYTLHAGDILIIP